MAQKVNIVVTDDLDGTEGASTVSFAVDGTAYEVDLNEKNADKLRKALAPYVEAGRRVSSSRGRGSSRGAQNGPAPKDIRAWANANGFTVPERGRIPSEVREAYEAAH